MYSDDINIVISHVLHFIESDKQSDMTHDQGHRHDHGEELNTNKQLNSE